MNLTSGDVELRKHITGLGFTVANLECSVYLSRPRKATLNLSTPIGFSIKEVDHPKSATGLYSTMDKSTGVYFLAANHPPFYIKVAENSEPRRAEIFSHIPNQQKLKVRREKLIENNCPQDIIEHLRNGEPISSSLLSEIERLTKKQK
jgi:hypothetical protein